MSDENKAGLADLQKQIRERLREGMARVERLEETTSQEAIDGWIGKEIQRYGGRRIEIDDAE